MAGRPTNAVSPSQNPASRSPNAVSPSQNTASSSQNTLIYRIPQDKAWLNPQYQSEKIVRPHELATKLRDPPEPVDNGILDRIQGSMAGMALGDALGAHVEFRPQAFLANNPVTDLEGGGTWGLKKGQFTDDTSMALCLANSLVVRRDFIPYDQLVRYKWWFRDGYMSSTGQCFDIGAATKESVIEFERRQREFMSAHGISQDRIDFVSDSELLREFDVDCSREGVAGNGALMRLTPVPLYFHRYPEIAVEFSGSSGRTTHGDQMAYDACRYYGALIVAAVKGKSKNYLLDEGFYNTHQEWFANKELHPEIKRIVQGSYKKDGHKAGIRGRGYIVDALEAALWAFWSDKGSFETGVLAAVNLGDDTDTTAAIYGQLAGAYYGYHSLPEKWLNQLYAKDFILCLSKWIVYEGQRWALEKSQAFFVTDPTSRPQSSTNVDSSNKPNSSDKPPQSTRSSNNATGASRSGTAVNSSQRSDWDDHLNENSSSEPGYARKGLRSCQDVSDWLKDLGPEYAAYSKGFQGKMVDGFWLLNYVNDESLIQYGVGKQKHRKKILSSIQEIRNKNPRKSSTGKK